ncbi:hypothetical protein [Carboxydothermus hydrogenoformans]|uniref:Uncharacterized protein n=1 Tax=Carboxydothermus hydrogenoformans (strain ATCC BAA-161 / DSM 6008 / Z-2901) TaxID=246194 RepID=Q3AA85_CARHZ|nr:hypothetical protein [Carboxydothermus hydrogenoformans]ABB15098.1 hypothetical protein CHY_2135 [Carboxydothermus hydrogenoformans Z-2901]
MKRVNKNKFIFEGDVVEITSVPGEELRMGITLTIERRGTKWLITDVKQKP